MLSAKFPKYREKSGQGQINLLTDTIKFCAVDIDDIGLTISNATNATPIVITTDLAHGLATDDEVLIRGVAGNTAANGVWKVTVLTTTTFSLQGSAGNGAYVAGADYVVKLNTLEFLGDISAGARIAVSGALANKSITRGYFTANNPVFPAPSGDAFELIVLFKDTGNAATSPLIMISADSPSFPVTPNGVDDIEIIINNFIFRQ